MSIFNQSCEEAFVDTIKQTLDIATIERVAEVCQTSVDRVKAWSVGRNLPSADGQIKIIKTINDAKAKKAKEYEMSMGRSK